MATQRKHQTVQFLFEASPENNITRCVISKTSDTFENDQTERVKNDEERLKDDTVIKQSSKTVGSNEERDGLRQSSSARWVLNTGGDSNYLLKTQQGIQQNYTDKVSVKASHRHRHRQGDFFKDWSSCFFNEEKFVLVYGR